MMRPLWCNIQGGTMMCGYSTIESIVSLTNMQFFTNNQKPQSTD